METRPKIAQAPRLLGHLLLFILLGFAGSSAIAEECLECHNDDQEVMSIQHRAHGADLMCTSCHGASDEHANKPRKNAPDKLFDQLSAEDSDAVCTDCHDGGHQKNWGISEHAASDVACVNCHDVHGAQDPVQQRDSQSEICMGCHVEQKAESLKFSRHPIKEGVVTCTDCHETHGGKGPSMLTESTVNETCYQCHTEKRGPFLWEHEPVQDDCTNCHTPHGSVNDNMLMVRQPVLCQQCHISSSHRGANHLRFNESENRIKDKDYNYGKGCVNCHGEIHGSNHAAGGGYFE